MRKPITPQVHIVWYNTFYGYIVLDKLQYFNCKNGGTKIQRPIKIRTFPAGIYLLKVNNRNTRTRCEICSMLTIKTPERR